MRRRKEQGSLIVTKIDRARVEALRAEIDHGRGHSGAVVAHSGERVFLTPKLCKWAEIGERYQIEVEVEVVDGRALFRSIVLSADDHPLSPLDVQQLGWSQIAEQVLEENALEVSTRGVREYTTSTRVRSPRNRSVRANQARARRGQEQKPPEIKPRNQVSRERLLEVVRLHDEAQRRGTRWDNYAHDELGLSKNYLRKLYGIAIEKGLT